MNRKNRTHGEITQEFLVAAADKKRSRTKLMYLTFCSFQQTKEYCIMLEEKGLLEHLEDDTYLTTDKGRQFIQINKELKKLVND